MKFVTLELSVHDAVMVGIILTEKLGADAGESAFVKATFNDDEWSTTAKVRIAKIRDDIERQVYGDFI